MIDDVRIDSDAGGFTLILVGDHVDEVELYLADPFKSADALRLRLPQSAALALLRAAESEIGPWAAEGQREYAAWRQASPEERAAVLGQDEPCHHDGWQAGCPQCEENERAAVDLLRKAERERG